MTGFAISLATATELADAAQAINRHLASGGFTTKPPARGSDAHLWRTVRRPGGRCMVGDLLSGPAGLASFLRTRGEMATSAET